VRWSDCDPLGIIWYGAYLKYFEAFQVEFHSPAQMDELLDVEAGVAKIGNTSLTFRFEAYKAGERLHRASATLTVVSVVKESLAKKPIEPWLREALAPYVIP